MSCNKSVESKIEAEARSKIFCSAYGCNSRKSRNPELSFHSFPKLGKTKVEHIGESGIVQSVDRRKLWIQVLQIGKKVTGTMKICSLHFKQSDYKSEADIEAGVEVKRKYLKEDAIPSQKLPTAYATLWNINSCEMNMVERKSEKEMDKLLEEKVQQYQENVIEEEEEEERLRKEKEQAHDEIQMEEYEQCEHFLNDNNENDIGLSQKSYCDKEIQCNLGNDSIGIAMNEEKLLAYLHSKNVLYNFASSVKTDEQLSTATGLHSFAFFNKLVESVELVVPHLKKHGTVLSIRDRVLMTFVKLKQNVSYSFLCILFPSVTVRYCSDIIGNMIDILCEILDPCIHFASLNECSKNMPLCFAEYSNTQIILDCTEIRIQRPKNLCCQIATFSHYKGTNTVKFMTGVTPGGVILYVSKAYGGRASDKAIFEQSCLIEDIDKRGAVMVDKGFLIDDICLEHNIKLLRPPFLAEKEQFSETEAIDCANIASARVHVERLNQRLKVYKDFYYRQILLHLDCKLTKDLILKLSNQAG